MPAASSPAPQPQAASPKPVVSASAQAGAGHAFGIMGGGTPGFSVALPETWQDVGGSFAVKYPVGDEPGPVLGVSVWDVGLVFRDACKWDGSAFDPGPTVDNLVDALVAQQTSSATSPTEVTLAGHSGKYLELTVPPDLKSTAWTQSDDCDLVVSEGNRNYQRWLGASAGTRWSQVPGQVDRLWVLDVDGQRLVVDATYSPDTSHADRVEQAAVVDSLVLLPQG